MHIEPVIADAVHWIMPTGEEKKKGKKSESLQHLQQNKRGWVYCLFDYEKRNPLSKDADVTILSAL